MHMASVLGEVHRLLTGGVAAAHHGEFLIAELRCGAVTDRTGTDAFAPEGFLRGKLEAVGTGAGGDHQGVGADGLSLDLNAVGLGAEINAVGICFQQVGAPTHRLGLHQVHQVGPEHAIREARKILHMGGGHQLATGDATALEPSDQQRLQVGPCCVDGGCVPGWP